jgi:hypothetical protein
MTTEKESTPRPEVPTPVIIGVFALALGFHAAGFFVWRAAEVMDLHWKLRDPNTYAHTAVWLAALGLGLLSIRGAQSEKRGRPPRSARHPLCCNCLVPYIEGAHFCPTCARPLTWFACTGSYETIYAEAWLFGKAASQPSHPSHLWVLTLLALHAFAAPLIVLWPVLHADDAGFLADGRHMPLSGLLALPLLSLNCGIWVALALRAWSRWGLASTDADDDTPPVRYGSPPWWTRDEHWRVPLAVGDEDDLLPEPDAFPDPNAGLPHPDGERPD